MGAPTRFGSFSLDNDRRQLFEAGREVHLSPKGYDLLTLLLAERPRVLSKAELHERLWAGTFVSDATLASVVAEVRAALGEGGRDGRYIRTVHAFGYGFAAEALESADTASSATGARAEPSRIWLDSEGVRFDLTRGDNVIGRDAECEVRLEAATISRHHARIVVGERGAMVEDLTSKNGTWVNGARVTARVAIGDGDEIRLGAVVVRYRDLREPGSTITLSAMQW